MCTSLDTMLKVMVVDNLCVKGLIISEYSVLIDVIVLLSKEMLCLDIVLS